jgi:aminoglycoside/choline kinase family phosphotransferase
MTEIEQNLVQLYKSRYGTTPVSVTKLPGSGSYRSYYRLQGLNEAVIGAHNDDIRENEAFISFTNHFHQQGLPVPQILANDPMNRIYLITDLGDTTLYQFLTEKRAAEPCNDGNAPDEGSGQVLPQEVIEMYKKATGWLPLFQVKAGRSLDYTVCYPRAAFDRQSMMWDLNYFKYYFLKLAKIPFDEQALEDDFASLCDLLLEADADFFLFRDFQSRNIMIVNGEPWFIDYQGGRKGALQYDVASLLFDGKADIPMAVREDLLHYYLDKLGEVHLVDREKFLGKYYAFVLIRILQALGAYGFRGYYENKTHFLQSIPFALRNLHYLRTGNRIGFGLNALISVIDMMVENPILYNQQSLDVNNTKDNKNNELKKSFSQNIHDKKLTVTIYSFSFKKLIPKDENGNGGGFTFDCRALPNPGRFEEFRQLNGKDQPVIDFLQQEPAVGEFLGYACSIVDQSVKAYIDRGFEHLMVSFGCTGGQHRSVFCAEELAKYLKDKYDITVKIIHLEQANVLNT